MKMFSFILLLGGLIFLSAISHAFKEPIIFPREGQSRNQQTKDKGYCSIWAKDETGVDPSYVRGQLEALERQYASEGQTSKRSGGLLKGAARGAAIGAVGSNANNNVGKRAAQGAMVSGMRGRDQRKAHAAQNEPQRKQNPLANLDTQLNTYNRAYSVCLDAKGYSVT